MGQSFRIPENLCFHPWMMAVCAQSKAAPAIASGLMLILMQEAHKHRPRGILPPQDLAGLALRAGLALPLVQDLMQAFHDRGLIDADGRLSLFERNGPTSTKRVQAFRARQKEKGLQPVGKRELARRQKQGRDARNPIHDFMRDEQEAQQRRLRLQQQLLSDRQQGILHDKE